MSHRYLKIFFKFELRVIKTIILLIIRISNISNLKKELNRFKSLLNNL